ncbi:MULTISPECIES: glycine cleavage system protein R [Pseudomonas]|jgi:glycine cleavage system regulatory protein|uniref:Glycine cleavage system protein R n=2 Tax=Pseudomonas abyssi TaxID=170540 RepID=A0ACD6B3Y2_9PSED|nr:MULTISPECIES: ACT domain-containing protein [Pseudomonadaceae]MAC98306.1 glycine cleavage system protein R [Pseudomonadales bacterium]MAG67749.1 glycine cleavage system protein R [Pseudomonadales bacterium]PBK05169.1 glycine cleavage system protein R [Pseudomonas abyssi]RGP55924.1 glycine cleavage system protein R [Halopseudomonas gallaeciensis]|tara:strand:- start:5031 stop:5546 length:516 start_codon:yes stop_codon:yes gene_type:complete
MTTPLVLTVISADKPGLVESLAQTINRHGGNWLESRMARMAGQFAGILRVDVGNDQLEALRIDLEGLTSLGINVQVAISGQAEEPVQSALILNLVGNDRAGIVHEVSRVLASHGVNVESLETECVPAPMSADMLFKAEAHLGVYPQTDLDALRDALENLTDDLMVELRNAD